MAVTGAAAASCFERTLQNILSNVTYSPGHRQAGGSTINIQSTLRTAPDLCKNVSFTMLFGRKGNSYPVSTQSDVDKCSSQYRDAGRTKN